MCTERSIEDVPMLRPTLDEEPQPGVPLCVEHRRLLIADSLFLGWCPVGRHYSHHMDYCQQHGQLMLAP